ncbi:MAG: DUF1116 domain-containing protein [Candidatus Izemoplasmataceae bacterium]
MKSLNSLFKSKVKVANIGIEMFHEALNDQATPSCQVDWQPVAGGDQALIEMINFIQSDDRVEKANLEAVNRLKDAQPIWVDVQIASDVLGLDKHTLLHAGPPIKWEAMSEPMKGAVYAALKYEGLAHTDEEAYELAGSGKITFEPCHHRQAVGPMTGIISHSMPLICVKNDKRGNYAYSTFNEGAGDVARFGAFSENTVKRLKWIETVLAPAMKKALTVGDPINLKVLIAQALNMGDELHMRNNASSTIFIKAIIERLVRTSDDLETLTTITKFLTTNNDQFFLNFAMAASKASSDAAHNIPYSTMVTAMARNGVEIGIRVSGLEDLWFTADAAEVDGLYFPGYTKDDANKDIGDSAIMETAGLGGFAMVAGPAIVKILGAGTYQDALNYTSEMYDITLSESRDFTIPNLEFRGTPTGIDIVKVVETGSCPVINTAIASKKAGVGMIGAGVARAPMPMFKEALVTMNKTIKGA